MTKRSTWCEFDKDTRKYIQKRDNERCVICGSRGALQIMHIFVSRAQGGKGTKQNGCLGCIRCHNELDNGSNVERTRKIRQYCEGYLIEKENITNVEQLKKELVYHKQQYNINMALIIQECENAKKSQFIVKNCKKNTKIHNKIQKNVKNSQKYTKKCKNCIYLIKDKYKYNSTMPNYYCKYRKININKSTNACSKYMEEN